MSRNLEQTPDTALDRIATALEIIAGQLAELLEVASAPREPEKPVKPERKFFEPAGGA